MMSSLVSCRRTFAVAVLALLLGSARSPAQPPVSPPPPRQYPVELRYQIHAPRDVRLRLFPQMVQHLRSAGLDVEPGEEDEAEDPNASRMAGTLRVTSLRHREDTIDKLFGDRHVKSVLLIPADYTVPDNAQAPVHV